MKKVITISIDQDLYDLLKTSNEPISKIINRLVKDFFNPKNETPEDERWILYAVEFGKRFKLSKEESCFTLEHLHHDFTTFYNLFRRKFNNPMLSSEYAQIRLDFKEEFK